MLCGVRFGDSRKVSQRDGSPDDVWTVSELLCSVCRYAEQLPPVGTEGPALDVDFLERANARRVARPAAGPAAGGKAGAASAAADEPQSELAAIAAAAAAERPKRKRKKRPAKLPKDYNPNIPPDPERWLPRYERSEYKKRCGS